jgi:uncharacterized protein YdiU (UPF0061 family)
VDVAADPIARLEHTFEEQLAGLYEPWQAAPVPAPELLALNDELAIELGLDPARLRTDEGLAFLTAQALPEGTRPVAQAYSGHQFGGFSPRLGDGRALLVGELVDVHGERRDLHLKGSGRTPFARGGDGKAAVGPMLREYVISEAMAALGIPTTRSLAVVGTGERVVREQVLPGAILVRVASSHLRVGTFQYAALLGDGALLRRLADHAIERHHPTAGDAPEPYLALLEAVLEAQAALVARWLGVGFVHGVMNTDNTTISGETIDYGPCAFLDAYDPATVYSSIDHGGRYAYGNQPAIVQWNLARLAEALLPLIDDDQEAAVARATEVVHLFPARFRARWREVVAAKLGLAGSADDDDDGGDDDLALADDLLTILHEQHADLTASFRALSSAVRGDAGPLRAELLEPDAIEPWLARHRARLERDGRPVYEVAAAMDRANPRYIPRNHLVEAALDAATAGDLEPFERLVAVVRRPYDDQPGAEAFARPAPPGSSPYVTYCGT